MVRMRQSQCTHFQLYCVYTAVYVCHRPHFLFLKYHRIRKRFLQASRNTVLKEGRGFLSCSPDSIWSWYANRIGALMESPLCVVSQKRGGFNTWPPAKKVVIFYFSPSAVCVSDSAKRRDFPGLFAVTIFGRWRCSHNKHTTSTRTRSITGWVKF